MKHTWINKIREPIEVRVLPDSITVVSYPDLDRSIRLEDLETGRFVFGGATIAEAAVFSKIRTECGQDVGRLPEQNKKEEDLRSLNAISPLI